MARVHFDNCASLCTDDGFDTRERWATCVEAMGYRRQLKKEELLT